MASRSSSVNAAFKRNFRALLERAGSKADVVARKVALDLLTSVVFKSPVDTGRFRANWQLSVNRYSQSAVAALEGQVNGKKDLEQKYGDESESGTTKKGLIGLAGFRLGDKVYITNSLSYAIPLEYGHSSQAPAGMVRITVAEFDQFLKKAVGEVK